MLASHLPFLDWLKALGIALIVWGHVAAATTVTWTPPIYPKQLGVAFFVFASGFTLARERRGRWRVVYNRFFEVALFGLACAIGSSVIGLWLSGNPLESNYLPFALGANVVINAFPANPTTWYIGTYLHLLLLWAMVLRRRSVGPALIVGSVALEIVVRAAAIYTVGEFVAYMLFPNWVSVLLFGLAAGGRRAATGAPAAARHGLTWVAALGLISAWPLAMRGVRWDLTFPLMSPANAGAAAPLMTSLGVSFVYLAFTAAAYGTARTLPHTRLVHFLARNTVIVFIVHMPVYFVLELWLRDVLPYPWRVSTEFVLCLFGLAAVSEGIRRALRPERLRDRLWQRLRPGTAPVDSQLA